MTSNQIAYANFMENVRHNKRTEGISRRNVDVAEAQVGLGYANLAEMYRHNYSTENLTAAQTETKQQEADTHAYEAETKRLNAYANILPDWLVAAGYGFNELVESPMWKEIGRVSEPIARQKYENSKREHRKR